MHLGRHKQGLIGSMLRLIYGEGLIKIYDVDHNWFPRSAKLLKKRSHGCLLGNTGQLLKEPWLV